jgi:hypothetical protein
MDRPRSAKGANFNYWDDDQRRFEIRIIDSIDCSTYFGDAVCRFSCFKGEDGGMIVSVVTDPHYKYFVLARTTKRVHSPNHGLVWQ